MNIEYAPLELVDAGRLADECTERWWNQSLCLKRFLEGGADARQEVRATLSLDAIQEKHRRMMRESSRSPVMQNC